MSINKTDMKQFMLSMIDNMTTDPVQKQIFTAAIDNFIENMTSEQLQKLESESIEFLKKKELTVFD